MYMFVSLQEVFKCTVEVNMVRYIAAILDYIAADILKVVTAKICTLSLLDRVMQVLYVHVRSIQQWYMYIFDVQI